MAVPKKKTSISKRNMRRSHDALKANVVSKCPECGNPNISHTICKFCGTYRGRNTKSS